MPSPFALARRNRRVPAHAVLACIALCTACAASASPGPSPDLRLWHVVLYQNGIGYFERTGVMKSERLRLQFREREVDDVLKSLVVVEKRLAPGVKPSTVNARLPQQGPRDPEASTSIELVLSPATSRSISIAYAVPTAAWKATYRVILPEPEDKPGRGALLQAWALIDNVSDEDWSNVNVTLATGAPLSYSSSLRSPRFIERPEAESSSGVPTILGPIASERTPGVDRDGDGIADASDACPTEPGRPSAEARSNGCPQQARLVTLTESEIRILQHVIFERGSDVVRPVSQPIIGEIARVLSSHPEIRAVTIEGHSSSDERDAWGLAARRAAAVRAALMAQGVTTELVLQSFGDTRPLADNATEGGRSKNRRVELRVARREQDESSRRRVSGTARAEDMAKTPSVSAAPQDIAGTVRYDITHPISIPRQSSTLVTIINEYMPGEDIFLFRPDPAAPASQSYPFRAARIENKTHLGLQPGSVSIFAGGTFVGEGLLDRLNPGETALIPYALDSSTSVRVSSDESEQPMRMLSLVRGVMIVENSATIATRYEIAPGKQAPSRIYIRHERRPDYEVKSLPPGTETAPAAHLMPIPIQPGKPSVFVVEEAQPRRRELAIFDTDGARLALYLKRSSLAPDDEKRVQQLIQLRIDLGKIQDEIDALRAQMTDAAQRSAELRENIRAIEKTPRTAALQQKLVERLTEATTQAEQLSARLADRTAAQAETRARLTESLRELRIVANAS